MQEIFFVLCLRLSDHKVLHNNASSSTYKFHQARIFSLFSLVFRTSNFWNKTISPFALVGYETGNSQLGAAHGIIVNYFSNSPFSFVLPG